MKKIVKLLALPIMVASLFALSSCEKLVDDASETAESAEDFSEDQEAISDFITVIQDVASTDPYMLKKSNSILPEGSVTYIDSSFTDGNGIELSISINEPALCSDGLYRSGYLEISANKPFSEVGCILEVQGTFWAGITANLSLDDFGFDLNGKHLTIERIDANKLEVDYEMQFYYTVKDFANRIFVGEHYTGTGHFVLTQTEGLQTPGTDGDKFVVSGSSTGENHNETPYTTTITKDMVYVVDKTCSKTFIEGAMTLKNSGSTSDLKIDFGSGACDNDVEITLPGGIKKTYTVN
ncbi:MAG: hypothetical protein ACYC1Q_06455 [Bacteroidia bacterium]